MKIHSILTHFCWKEKLHCFLLSKSQLSKQKGAGCSQFKPSEASTSPPQPSQVAGWLGGQHGWLMCLHQIRWVRAKRMHTDLSCEPMTGLQTGDTHTHTHTHTHKHTVIGDSGGHPWCLLNRCIWISHRSSLTWSSKFKQQKIPD